MVYYLARLRLATYVMNYEHVIFTCHRIFHPLYLFHQRHTILLRGKTHPFPTYLAGFKRLVNAYFMYGNRQEFSDTYSVGITCILSYNYREMVQNDNEIRSIFTAIMVTYLGNIMIYLSWLYLSFKLELFQTIMCAIKLARFYNN